MSNMSSVTATTVECIALQQQCIDKGRPINLFSDRVRDKWSNRSIRVELTGCTESDTPQVGEVHEYIPCGGSADMNTAQAGEKHWTGNFIFENEWQSFHTKKDRGLKLKTSFHECNPGRYKIAAKVMDIFGNDTMKIIEVSV